MIGYIESSSFPVYTYGEMVVVTPYHIRWTPSDISTGTFKMEGSTYNFSDYNGSFGFNGGIIQSSAFSSTLIQTLNTNADVIEKQAFIRCYNLQTASLSNCSSIGSWCFAYCSSLTSVYIPQITRYPGDLFTGCGFSEFYSSTCVYVGDYCFDQCSSLMTVDLPACSYVGERAFFRCPNITTISLPACSYVGSGVFYGCNNLTSVYIPNIVSYGQIMFGGCGFSEFYSSTCVYVGRECFYYCGSLITVDLPACGYIDIEAFFNCSSLTTVSLQNCSHLGSGVFTGCSSLNTITLGWSSVCDLFNSRVFAGAGITSSTGSIFVPSSLVSAYKSDLQWSYFSNRIYPINN